MTVQIALVAGVVVLVTAGVSLMLERSLTRMLFGFLLVGNGVNLLLFTVSGAFGRPPVYESGTDPADYSDPLPQVFILTAIVITFGVTAFLLALVYRAWKLAQEEVQDDSEDLVLRGGGHTGDAEEFTEADSGDTEFGQHAEAAITGHSIIESPDAGAGEDPEEPDPDGKGEGA